MNQYFATFPAGTYPLIARQLKTFKLSELSIEEHDESSVIFSSSLVIEKLIELRYLTNVYVVIDDTAPMPKRSTKGKYFRLMLLKEGSPAHLDDTTRAILEKQIGQKFKLTPNTHHSRNDFCLIQRTGGKHLLTIRLPKAKFKRAKLSKGELRPELAHILCLAAGLKAKHSFVDMFAGYGSIPLEAARGFGCKRIVAVDNQKLPNRHEQSFTEWHTADARNLGFLTDNSIDRVVTDPPWGVYETEAGDLSSLYTEFSQELTRALKPGGVAVILSGFGGAGESFTKASELTLIGKWDVLVSGKKASIFKLQKT